MRKVHTQYFVSWKVECWCLSFLFWFIFEILLISDRKSHKYKEQFLVPFFILKI